MADGLTLGHIAEVLGATVEGDSARIVRGVAPLEAAGPDDITFVIDTRYRAAAQASRAGAFLAAPDVTGLPAPVLRARAPRLALIELIALFHPAPIPAPGIAPSAVVASGARVASTASIGGLAVVESGAVIEAGARLHPLVYVGAGAVIGEDTILYPHVVVREGVRVGRRVIVHAGAVIGADGFGYVFDGTVHRKVPQVGSVRIEDDVEIGANATIDRATLGETVVRRGTKIDNLVQVGHNVEIGEHTVIAAQTGISGSCRIGGRVVMAGQVGLADHVSIGDGAVLGAQSGVHADVAPGQRLLGTPARPLTQSKRIYLAEGRLPDLIRRVRALERRLAALEGHPAGQAPDGDVANDDL